MEHSTGTLYDKSGRFIARYTSGAGNRAHWQVPCKETPRTLSVRDNKVIKLRI